MVPNLYQFTPLTSPFGTYENFDSSPACFYARLFAAYGTVRPSTCHILLLYTSPFPNTAGCSICVRLANQQSGTLDCDSVLSDAGHFVLQGRACGSLQGARRHTRNAHEAAARSGRERGGRQELCGIIMTESRGRSSWPCSFAN
jgi:hypothetical protein